MAASTQAHARSPDARILPLLASIGRIHIVAIAALGAMTFAWLFLGHRPLALALVVAVDWFLVNLINRVVDLKEDRANGIVGADFVARHKRAVLVFGLVVLAASFVLVHLAVAPELTPLRFAFHALGFLYNFRLLEGRARIKEMYFWKNTASACGFLLTVFAYPLVLGHATLGVAAIVLLAAFFFAFEISYEILYDLRDAPGDRAAGVRTYPVVHGEKRALVVVYALLFVAGAILVGGFAASVLPWRAFVMIAAPAAQAAWCARRIRAGQPPLTSRDCVVLTWIGAAMLAFYNIWISFGLPGMGET